MQLDVRVLSRAEDLRRARVIFRTAMVGLPVSLDGTVDEVGELHEPGRTLGAFCDAELVGAVDSYSGWLTVPGGARLPHAAVTHVGVLPSHTRRGIASTLLRRQLDDIAERGEVLASLRATEAVIYERFGYGVANWAMTVELDRARARFRPGVPRGGPVRLVDLEHADQLLADIYQSANWVGAIARPPYWWRARRFWHGSAPVYAVVHGARGAEDGYAVYHALNAENWFGGRRTVLVDDLVAHTPAAYAGLTRYFAELDLVDTVRFECRPCDDPLPALLVDSRAARTSQLRDETWLRIVDVPGALARCAYRGPGSVVLAVVDPIRPINTGHYRVSAQVTEPTTAPEDLTLDVAALAAVYLGGTPWWHLARAGRVVEHTHGALEVAAELFTQSSPPFSGTMF